MWFTSENGPQYLTDNILDDKNLPSGYLHEIGIQDNTLNGNDESGTHLHN